MGAFVFRTSLSDSSSYLISFLFPSSSYFSLQSWVSDCHSDNRFSLQNLLETTKVISQASFVDSQRPDEAAAVRACAVHLLTTLLIYRKSVRNNNNFNLSAWSMITERILSDPSRKVFRAALSAVNMLLSDVMGGASFCNNGLSQNTDPHDKALYAHDTSMSLLMCPCAD